MQLNIESLRRHASNHREVMVFGAIGLLNTALHTITVIMLVESSITTAVPANVAGFAVANTASFFANSFLTFQRRPSWRLYRTFLTVSLSSLALTVCLSGLAEAMKWHYLIGLLLVILFGPVLSFVLHKVFTFGR
jgi:putative flippase GtrA